MSDAQLRTLTWNPHIGRADELSDVLGDVLRDARWPHVASLQEVWDWSGKVPGYRRVAASTTDFPHHEARGVQLLVRTKGVRLRRATARQVDGGVWIGPVHGRPHPPRVYPLVTVGHGGTVWDIIGVHRCPGGPNAERERNRQAWVDEHQLLIDWAERRPHGPLVMLGDHNNRASDPDPLSVSGLASRIGARLALERIDGAIARGVLGIGTETMPDAYGSDHHPVRVQLSAPRQLRREFVTGSGRRL